MGRKIQLIIIIVAVVAISMQILDSMGYGYLMLPYIILFPILQSLAMAIRFLRREILPNEVKIPTKFELLEREILQLGFVPHAVVKLTYYFMPQRQWYYIHPDEHVYAYINEESGRLWFSSYFENHFDVTTHFKEGEKIKSNKIVSNVVKKSVHFAFLFHLRECQKYAVENGNLLLFAKLEEHWAWIQRQTIRNTLRVTSGKQLINLAGRFVIGFIVTLLFTILSIACLFFFLPKEFLLAKKELILGLVTLVVNVGFWIWLLYPVVFPKAVEDEKNRKIRG